jgi:hypothetical protein
MAWAPIETPVPHSAARNPAGLHQPAVGCDRHANAAPSCCLVALEQSLIAWIRDPVDRAEAQFLQLLWWCSHLQGLHAAPCSNSQELCPQADAQHRSAMLVPGRQPVQFLPQPVHARLVAIVHAHRTTEHKGDAVRTALGSGRGSPRSGLRVSRVRPRCRASSPTSAASSWSTCWTTNSVGLKAADSAGRGAAPRRAHR